MKQTTNYNNESDEFTLDLSLEMRLEKYIKKHFYPAYTIATLAQIYLIGGSIRDLMYKKKPKDMDFVVLGNKQLNWILEVLKGYNIKYDLNKFGGYKFTYNDTIIDLWTTEDLFSSIQYNVDGLLFNLNTNSLISLTFNDFKNNGLKLVNEENNIENGREEKLITFENKYLDKKRKIIAMYHNKDIELNIDLYEFIYERYKYATPFIVCHVTEDEYKEMLTQIKKGYLNERNNKIKRNELGYNKSRYMVAYNPILNNITIADYNNYEKLGNYTIDDFYNITYNEKGIPFPKDKSINRYIKGIKVYTTITYEELINYYLTLKQETDTLEPIDARIKKLQTEINDLQNKKRKVLSKTPKRK